LRGDLRRRLFGQDVTALHLLDAHHGLKLLGVFGCAFGLKWFTAFCKQSMASAVEDRSFWFVDR
ncbi:hypothetical protein, partial [Staphylococcus aureus]